MNASRGLCQCETDEWKTVHNELWSSVMSLYEDRYVDVKFVDKIAGYVTVTVDKAVRFPSIIAVQWLLEFFLSLLSFFFRENTVKIGRSTLDTPLAMGALASCLSICFLITSFKWNGPDSTITFGNSIYSANGNPWRGRGRTNVRQNRAEFLRRSGMVASRGTLWNSPRRPSGWSDSPVKGMISPTTGRVTKNQQDYFSTFHRTPNRKKFSKKEWENFTQESTRHAVAELASFPKFTD
ncbi:unnamed protein product [Camellia sinensis]